MQKFISVTKPSMPKLNEYVVEIKGLWKSRWLTNMGAKHKAFEAALKRYLHTENVVLFANGHLALEYAIQAFDLSGEVITTPFTFASTTHAIVRNGLIPVFCDIDPIKYTIDASKIERLITDKTSAIMPVHVYGQLCDTEAIEKVAQKHHLKVIYDAAHTFGIPNVANYGDASVFSFHATKVFNTIEGGAVTFSDSTLKTKMDRLKNFGVLVENDHVYFGGNGKMNEFQAAMGICNLRHLAAEIKRRRVVVQRYQLRLKDIPSIAFMQYTKESNYSYLPVLFKSKHIRDAVYTSLQEKKIEPRKYFYPLTNKSSIGRNGTVQTPVAQDVADRILVLPLYANLLMVDVDRICDIILEQKILES